MSTLISQPRFSCALGAQQTILAIPRAVPIIHAGPGCSAKATHFAFQSGFQGEGYAGGNHVSCTNSTEKEVVFGGEKKLTALLTETLKVIDADLYVALSGCTAGIIGDNVAEVARSFAERGKPVVGEDCAGFRGNNYFGHEVVVNAIIDQYVDSFYQEEKPEVKKGLVNLFASVPFQDPFWRGDLEELKRILEEIGLQVNVLFGYSSKGVEEWKTIPQAEFNILVGPWCGKKVVEHLKLKYKTPYIKFPYLPMGAQATSKFLREIGKAAGIEQEKVESVISKNEKRFYDYLVSFSDFVAEYRGAIPYELYVAGDSLYSLGVVDYLTNELGFIPKAVYLDDDPKKTEEESIKSEFAKLVPDFADTVQFQADGRLIGDDIQKRLAGSKKALILGSYWERKIAHKTGNFFTHLSLPIIQEVITSSSYAGYNGGLRLLEKIYQSAFDSLLSAQTNAGH